MAEGLVRTDLNSSGISYKNGFPVTGPISYGTSVTIPHNFGAAIPQSSATCHSNPVTWLPSPTRFGNVNPPKNGV